MILLSIFFPAINSNLISWVYSSLTESCGHIHWFFFLFIHACIYHCLDTILHPWDLFCFLVLSVDAFFCVFNISDYLSISKIVVWFFLSILIWWICSPWFKFSSRLLILSSTLVLEYFVIFLSVSWIKFPIFIQVL